MNSYYSILYNISNILYRMFVIFPNLHFDLYHDLGDFYNDGGDGINLIKKLIENGYNELENVKFYFFLHTMNPVGKENMMALIVRYF